MNLKSLLSLSILSFLIPCFTNAQILNTEKFRSKKDTSKHYTALFDFNVNLQENQNTVFTLSSNANLTHHETENIYLIAGNYSTTSIDRETVFNSGYVHGRITFRKEHWLSPESYAQFQVDEARRLRNRSLTGIGLRFLIANKEKWGFTAGSGAMVEYEEWQKENGLRVFNFLLKSSSYLSTYIKLNKNTFYTMVVYYQFDPGRFNAPRFFADAKLIFEVSKKFNFNMSFNGLYDARPVIDIRTFIYNFETGISLNL